MTETTAEPLLWTVAQAMQRLNISRSLLYKILGDGELEAVKIGHRTYVTEQSIAAYFEKLRVEHPAQIAPRWRKTPKDE